MDTASPTKQSICSSFYYVLCECRRHECECIIHYNILSSFLFSFHYEPAARQGESLMIVEVEYIMQTFIVSAVARTVNLAILFFIILQSVWMVLLLLLLLKIGFLAV